MSKETDWRHECQMKFDVNFGGEPEPIPGLEVTELRTTAPTTMRRWDQYFGADVKAAPLADVIGYLRSEPCKFDFTPPVAEQQEEETSATLANGHYVIGKKWWVDRMIAFYGKKAEPEADLSSIEVVNGGFDDAAELIHSHLMENGIREPRPVRVTLDDGTEAHFIAQLRGDGSLSWTPAQDDPMAILAAEYTCSHLFSKEAQQRIDERRASFQRQDSMPAESEPKRSPNAKPALPSLSIEAPLGNRYGGLGWCDE